MTKKYLNIAQTMTETVTEEIIRKMNGKIWCESALKFDTKFKFILPLKGESYDN